MNKYIQLHILASYPPSNLNRDDLGRPKTAVMGRTQRLRISSQSLKRAWRESDFFTETLSDHIGIRTKEIGVEVHRALIKGQKLVDVLDNTETGETNQKISEKKAMEWARMITEVFGKIEKPKKEEKKPSKKSEKNSINFLNELKLKQLVHFSPEEISAIDVLIEKLVQSGENPTKDDLELLRKNHSAVDIAMFGRMLASKPVYNTEAAVQVSHAITVHEVAVEDDFFTAVDDLNRGEADMGAGHMGETEFASGLFYTYICINCDMLKDNLANDQELTKKALRALVESAVKIGPTGKQNSFASRVYASYLLAEKGNQQPRSLSVAFLQALHGKDLLTDAISTLNDTKVKMENVYGECSDSKCEMNAHTGEGTLNDILDFVAN